jgi:hypothetical protein
VGDSDKCSNLLGDKLFMVVKCFIIQAHGTGNHKLFETLLRPLFGWEGGGPYCNKDKHFLRWVLGP